MTLAPGINFINIFINIFQFYPDLFISRNFSMLSSILSNIRFLFRPHFSGKNMGDGWETARRLDRPPVLKTLPENPDILVKTASLRATCVS